jgi:hypothetical protein
MTRFVVHAAALAAVCLLPPAFATAEAQEPHTYRGTVYAVHVGGFDLLTGVGEALRVVYIRTPETTVVRGAGAPHAGRIKSGDVIEADCRLTESGLIAERIEQRSEP